MPKYKVGPELNECFFVENAYSTKESFVKAFQTLEFGYPSTDFGVYIAQTQWDKTRAPEGKHTLHLYAFEPYDLKDGGGNKWDEIGEKVADELLEKMRAITTNMGSDNILGRTIMTPLDYERHNPAMIRGDIGHFGIFNFQMGGNRPIPGWHHYRMPVKNLYLAGASTHPGMGVNGGGRAAAKVIMEDLGIDFDNVISK